MLKTHLIVESDNIIIRCSRASVSHPDNLVTVIHSQSCIELIYYSTLEEEDEFRNDTEFLTFISS